MTTDPVTPRPSPLILPVEDVEPAPEPVQVDPVPVVDPIPVVDPVPDLAAALAALAKRVAALELALGRGTEQSLAGMTTLEAAAILATNPANVAPFLETAKEERQKLRDQQVAV